MAKKKSSQKVKPISYVSDNVFLHLFNSNPIPMWIIDLGTLAFLEVNKAAIAKYGYSRRKFLSMTIKDIHTAKKYPYLTTRYSNSNLKFRYAGQFNHKLKNGSSIRVKIHVSNLYFTSCKCLLVMVEEISDKTNRETAVPGHAELLQTILNKAPITLVATDNKGVFTLSEGKMLERVALKPGQNVGRSALELFAGLTITLQNGNKINVKELFRRVMAGEQITAFTELNGIHFENQFVPHHNAKGKVIGLIDVATIITERLQAENALRESEDRYRNLVELSPDMIAVHREGRIVYMNPAAAKLLRGIDPQQLVGKLMVDFIHPDYRKTFEASLRQIYEVNEHRKLIETKFVLPDGEVVDVEVSSAPVTYLGKAARQVIVREITERKRAEEVLRESEKRFRVLVEKSFDGIVLLNSEGVLIFQANTTKLINGYSQEELVGKLAFDFVHPDFVDAAKKLFSNLLNSPGSSMSLELKAKQKDKSWRWVEATVTNLLKEPSLKAIVANYRDITERKQAEEVLSESEEKYRQVVQNIDEIIYAVKTDSNLFGGTVRFVSDQVKNILGYQPDEFLQDQELWFRIIHPEDVPKVMEITRKQFATKKSVTRVYRIQCKTNGEYRWVEDRSVPEINEQGNVVGIFGVVRDITERKKVVEQLQGISTAIEQTADSVMITDQNGIIEYVNSAFLMITGYTREDIIGKTSRILKSSMHSELFYKDFWKKIIGGKTYNAKFTNRKKTGELIIIEQTVTPVKNESGEITHFISTGRDVTEKERIEDELYKNARILQSYIQYSIAPLVLLDKDFNFLQVNEAYAKACQREISEFKGHNHFEFYPSEAKADFEKVVNNKEAVRFVERPFVFPDHPEWGVTYWDWSLTPILDKNGEVEFLVFALRDVSERKIRIDEIKKSHEKLRALYSHLQNAREEERTRIAREIHDSIGQSLTGLKMDLSFLETELAQQEDMRERNKLYGKIQTMYILLDEMIQSVRDVSAQLRPLILDSLGLVTAIEWQAEEFQKKTGLTCECILPKEKVELNRDESTVLFRIFQECLTNIIRHAKATKVSIKLERKENHILLEVQDNGIGIDENVVKEINSLGLLGMKERALVLGGSVDIHGNSGSGTIVTVKIPQGE